jgi:hypothetical protein
MKNSEISKVMEDLGMIRQFEDMWHSRHGVKQKEDLEKRAVNPIKEYASSVVIQRFFEKCHLIRKKDTRKHESRRRVAIEIAAKDLQKLMK